MSAQKALQIRLARLLDQYVHTKPCNLNRNYIISNWINRQMNCISIVDNSTLCCMMALVDAYYRVIFAIPLGAKGKSYLSMMMCLWIECMHLNASNTIRVDAHPKMRTNHLHPFPHVTLPFILANLVYHQREWITIGLLATSHSSNCVVILYSAVSLTGRVEKAFWMVGYQMDLDT
jgi:hypothetical protein